MAKGGTDFTLRVMAGIRLRFEESGMSLQDFGVRMGYGPKSARKGAWQFLRFTHDPHLSMVEKAAAALQVSIDELAEQAK